MSTHIKITQPKTADEFKRYYHLRWRLLRAPWGQPEGSEIDTIEDQCFHVMAITGNVAASIADNNVIIGVGRLQYNSADEAQIRYMAVAPGFERHGIGRQLVEAMEMQAKAMGHKTIVLDAREPAVDFYRKLGFTVTEKSYLLFDAIQHYRMTKEI